MKKFLTSIIAIFFLAVPVRADASEPALIAEPNFYDFGYIYQQDGKVSTEFTIKNNGIETIKINRLSTSCGCTTAEMDTSDLQPNESRKMLVTFDPLVHLDQFGATTRMVYLQTSDSAFPELTIKLRANILDETGNVPIGEPTQAIVLNKEAIGNKQAVVFFNEACWDCGELVNETYPELFAKYDYELIKRDYINEQENRAILNEFNQKWGVPFELQSHLESFVGDKLLIGGHLPHELMSYLLEHPEKYDKLLVYQDEMHGKGTEYKVWDFKGEIKTYPLSEPITTYLDEKPTDKLANMAEKSFLAFFSLITVSAFLDGVNPCAIAVLLFFIAFLFSIKSTRKSIWKMGLTYIFAIYLAYFLIGIGLANAIIISGAPHLMAYIGAYLVIALGVIQLLTIIFPRFPIRLAIPVNTKATLEKWIYKGTLPAAFIGGFIVGLCTFPCSGGIYVAIIGMLASTQTYTQGILWMTWYNLIFVSPLIILLIMTGNPYSTSKLQIWERKAAKKEKLLIGITMITLGLIILYFFI